MIFIQPEEETLNMDLDDLLMMKGVLDVNWRTLDIRWTLFNGQSFRWMKRASSNEQHMIAVGVVGPYVLELSQNLQPTSITGDHDDKPKQSRSMKRSPADSSNRKIRDSIGSIKRSRSSEDDAETGENETAAKKQKLDRKSSNEVDQRVHWRLLNPLTCQQIKKDCQPNVLKDLIQQRLHTYFQLEVDLEELYREWCEKDPVFKKLSEKYSGVRIMQQDLTENLFSFICSSNNNIQRIGVLVRSLAMIYGRFLYHDCELGKFFQFPNIKDLSVSDKNYSVQGMISILFSFI